MPCCLHSTGLEYCYHAYFALSDVWFIILLILSIIPHILSCALRLMDDAFIIWYIVSFFIIPTCYCNHTFNICCSFLLCHSRFYFCVIFSFIMLIFSSSSWLHILCPRLNSFTIFLCIPLEVSEGLHYLPYPTFLGL